VQRSKGTTWRSLACAARGSEIAEFAMILPMLFLLLIGIFWFGQAFRIYGTITNAARDGALAAVNPACATCASVDPTINAWTVIQNDLTVAHIDPTQLRQPTDTPSVCACISGGQTTGCTPTTVPCDQNQTNICVQGVSRNGQGNLTEGYVQLSSTAATPGGAGTCGISVSFEYPFTFWLPFTSLNNQTIHVRAQAQARAETQ
jgi:hypothetical protein